MSSALAKNTLWLTVASVGQKVIAFLYFALIARTIGDDATGSYFLALALTTSLAVLDDIGLTSLLVREVAKGPERALLFVRNTLGWKLLTMPVTVILALLLPATLGFNAETAGLTTIAIAVMLADTLSLTFYGVMRGLQNLRYESIGICVGQLITATIGGVAIVTGLTDLRVLIVALIAGSVWNAIFAAYQVVRRLGLEALVPTLSMGFAPVKASFMFFLAAVFVKIYSYVDSFTLNRILGEGAVGDYSAAYKLTYAFQFLPLAFVGALYPAFAALKDTVELKKTFLKAVWYLSLLSAPIVFGIYSLAPEIILKFYGADYAEGILPLQILIFVLIVIFLDFPIGAILNARGFQATKTTIMGFTMVINIAANLILIPRLGIPGAAVAAVISFVFMFSAGWLAMRKVIEVHIIELLRETWGLYAAGITMAVVVITAKELIPWMLTIPLGAAVFLLVAVITKAIDKSHLQALRSLLIRRKVYAEDTPAHD